MRLITFPNHQDEPHEGATSSMSLGLASLTVFSNEADVMQGCQDGPLIGHCGRWL